MLDIIPTSIIITIVNFIAMFLFLRWLLLKPVSEFLEKRRQLIHEDLDNAKSDREKAQQILAEHRQMLAKGKGEAARIIEEAVRQADQRRDELIAKAEEEASAVIERAKVEISREQAKAIEQLRTEISTLSVAVAEKILAHSVAVQDQDRIFNEVLEELEDSYEKYGS
jgi:F-type H+-transporting ATPase subunit b